MAAGAYSGPIQPLAPIRQTINNAGGAQQGSSTPGNVHGVVIKAICPGQNIYVGVSSAVTTGTGYKMGDGETLTFEVKNLNKLWFIASADGQSISVLPFLRASVV